MIDGYDALGEIRVSSTARRQAEKEQRGRGDGGLGGGEAGAAGLPRMCQVCVSLTDSERSWMKCKVPTPMVFHLGTTH